ncbi:MAG: NAD-binding protein [Eubacteriales bacterium]
MYIVIAGGGKVGYYLTKTLLSYNHKIAVIELNKSICEKLADDLSIPVFIGDATKINILSAAATQKADIFIAVTGQDEENLISCQLAKTNFGVKRTIARVNNPKNIKVFQSLGVDTAVSSTSLISDLIEQEVDYSGMKTLTSIKNDKIVMCEILINKDSFVNNKKIKDLHIPIGCIIVSVIRHNEIITPDENTLFRDGDSIIIVSTRENKDEIRNYFLGND